MGCKERLDREVIITIAVFSRFRSNLYQFCKLMAPNEELGGPKI